MHQKLSGKELGYTLAKKLLMVHGSYKVCTTHFTGKKLVPVSAMHEDSKLRIQHLTQNVVNITKVKKEYMTVFTETIQNRTLEVTR